MALIVVLWFFIFLSVVSFEFSAAVREEGMAVNRYREETEGYYLALAGFEEALYHLTGMLQRPGGGLQQFATMFDGRCQDREVAGGRYRVCLVDEGGKLNLNQADEATLRLVFANLGIDEPQRSKIVDSILDWLDPDDLHRVNGAENEYYLSLSPPYTAKNGPFDVVEELLWVSGVTPELFYSSEERVGLGRIFTVDSGLDRVNLRTASAEMIHAILGLPLEKSREIVAEREKLSEKTLADVLKLMSLGVGDDALRRFVFTIPSVITIEATGVPAGSDSHRTVKGVVRFVGGVRGFDLLRWLDRDSSGEGGSDIRRAARAQLDPGRHRDSG